MLSARQAALYGGLAIALGIVTYRKPVMTTVGQRIVPLGSFTAFIVVLAHAVTVHIYALIGVPVSTSQAIVGSLVGIGLIKGSHTINYRRLAGIAVGWISTPFAAALIAALAQLYLPLLKE